jgi:putative Ca2+/H+ antiporter (TMEM165/GDT1 family)
VDFLVTALTAFVVIFLAELPDKTMFASLAMGARMRPRYVWLGTSTAFAVHATLAALVGSALAQLPDTPVKLASAAMFALGAVLLLRRASETVDEAGFDRTQAFWPAYSAGFVAVFISEWGDLTQLTTANLAANNGALPVGIGAFAALCSVSGLALLAGRTIAAKVPLQTVRRVAAGVMVVLALWSLAQAFS